MKDGYKILQMKNIKITLRGPNRRNQNFYKGYGEFGYIEFFNSL